MEFRKVGAVGKDGKSLIVTLPRDICKHLQIKRGEYVRFNESNGVIILSKVSFEIPKSKTLPMPKK